MNVMIFYNDLSWGERLKKYLLIIFKDNIVIRLFDIKDDKRRLCGKRCGIVFCQSVTNEEDFFGYILPCVQFYPHKCFILHNGKVSDYKKIYPQRRDYVKEAEEWLRSID